MKKVVFIIKKDNEEEFKEVLGNRISKFMDASRGICTVDQKGKLVQIVERTQIEKRKNGIVFTEDKGQTWEELDRETLVSMNK